MSNSKKVDKREEWVQRDARLKQLEALDKDRRAMLVFLVRLILFSVVCFLLRSEIISPKSPMKEKIEYALLLGAGVEVFLTVVSIVCRQYTAYQQLPHTTITYLVATFGYAADLMRNIGAMFGFTVALIMLYDEVISTTFKTYLEWGILLISVSRMLLPAISEGVTIRMILLAVILLSSSVQAQPLDVRDGSGKSTFTAGLSECYTQLKPETMPINLDPANHITDYDTGADTQHVTLDVQVPTKIVIMGTSNMSLNARFSKIKPIVVPTAKQVVRPSRKSLLASGRLAHGRANVFAEPEDEFIDEDEFMEEEQMYDQTYGALRRTRNPTIARQQQQRMTNLYRPLPMQDRISLAPQPAYRAVPYIANGFTNRGHAGFRNNFNRAQNGFRYNPNYGRLNNGVQQQNRFQDNDNNNGGFPPRYGTRGGRGGARGGFQNYQKKMQPKHTLIKVVSKADLINEAEMPFDLDFYTKLPDITELITVEDAIDRLGLGPNGELRYCMQTLSANAQWLMNKIRANKGKYLLLDCPGQLELYRSECEMDKLIRVLESNGVRLCAVHLTDSLYCPDPASFVSVVMSTLSAMVALEMPQINVLSKADLFNEAEMPFDLEFYTKLPDITKLVDVPDENPMLARYNKLNKAIGEVIQDMGLVSFIPLAVQSKADMAKLICTIDKAYGFQLIDRDIRDIVLQ